MDKIRVLVADDHPVVRAGVLSLIESQRDMTVVGEAMDGRDALAKAKALRPDVVLLDISMPGLSGLEVTRLLKESLPSARIVILSMHEKEVYVQQVLRSGALGYLLKGSDPANIPKAIRTAHAGEYFLCPRIKSDLIQGFIRGDQGATPVRQYDRLTDREQQVFRLLVEGHSTCKIADMLCVSPKTVEKHRTNVMKKLGFANLTEMVKYALSIGVIDLDFLES